MKIIKSKKIKIGNKVKIQYVKDRPGHDFRYALDSKKILKKIKWKPRTNLHTGLSMTIDWYLKNKKFISSISNKTITKDLVLKYD